MTVDMIRERVAAIQADVPDNEVAHSMEDDLYKDVLRAIAGGAADPAALAAEALKATEIKFTRWYA